MKYIFLCLFFVTFLVRLSPVYAMTSSNFVIPEYNFGSGGLKDATSTNYGLFGIAGQTESVVFSSFNYKANSGLVYTINSNVPPAPTFTNVGNSSNTLHIVLATGNNPTDAKFAIAISPDNFSSTTQYVQADDTIGSTITWQTNSDWGASGFDIIGFSPATYTVKVAAKQGNYTQSAFGPTASASTVTSTLTMSMSSNTLTFPLLDPGNVKNSTSTITVNISTNGVGGATIFAYDTNAGLVSPSTSYSISATSSDLSSTNEGYGLQGSAVSTTTGGPMEILSPYNGSIDVVGTLDTIKRPIFDSTNQPVNGTGTFRLKAKAGNTTSPAGDYADTITLIASGTF